MQVQDGRARPPPAPPPARASPAPGAGCGRGRPARPCAAPPRRRPPGPARRAAARPPPARGRDRGAVALQHLRVLAEVLAHEPREVLDDALLAARRAVAVVQEEDHGAWNLLPAVRSLLSVCPCPRPPPSSCPPPGAPGTSTSRSRRSCRRRRALGADVLVVDDGPSAATRAAAERHGVRYVAHDALARASTRRATPARARPTRRCWPTSTTTSRSTPAGSPRCIVADAAAARRRRRLHRPDPRPLRGPPAARSAAARTRRSRTSTSARPTATPTHAWGANMAVRRARWSASARSTRRASSTATSRSGRRG